MGSTPPPTPLLVRGVTPTPFGCGARRGNSTIFPPFFYKSTSQYINIKHTSRNLKYHKRLKCYKHTSRNPKSYKSYKYPSRNPKSRNDKKLQKLQIPQKLQTPLRNHLMKIKFDRKMYNIYAQNCIDKTNLY